MAASNPFTKAEEYDINRLHLTFLKEIPESDKIEKFNLLGFSPDKFELKGKDLFINCEGKYHKSKLSNNFIEKKLETTGTTRNWKTVLKLIELSD